MPGGSFLRKASLVVNGGEPGWKRDRKQIEKVKDKAARRAACIGLAGTVCAIVGGELLWKGALPAGAALTALKAASSACTAALLSELWRIHFCDVLLSRLQEHTRGAKFHSAGVWKSILKRRAFWQEVIVCALHCPPGVTFEISSWQLGNYVMYRGETMFCVLNTLRLYLCARVWKQRMLADLPRKHTVGEFLGVHIGYSFAVKRAFNSLGAVLHIGSAWLILVFVLAYWYRAAEFSACSLPSTVDSNCQLREATEWYVFGEVATTQHILYYQNAAWIVWVTATTVGYGDMFPITHCGRAVASIAAVAGLLMAALTTASMWSALNRTQEEESALNMLKRFQAKQKTLEKAVNLLSIWWRRRTGKGMTLRQRFSDVRTKARQLNRSKRQTNVGLDSVKSMSAHLNDLTYESRDLVRQVDELMSLAKERDGLSEAATAKAETVMRLPSRPLKRRGSVSSNLLDLHTEIGMAGTAEGNGAGGGGSSYTSQVRRQSTMPIAVTPTSGNTGAVQGPGAGSSERLPTYGYAEAKEGVEGSSLNSNGAGPWPLELPGCVSQVSGHVTANRATHVTGDSGTEPALRGVEEMQLA